MNGLTIMPFPQILALGKDQVTPAEAQCDCACPDLPVCHTPAPLSATTLLCNPALQAVPLGSIHHVVFVPSGEHIAVLNESAMYVLEAFSSPVKHPNLLAICHTVWGDRFRRVVGDLARMRFLIAPDAPQVQQPFDGDQTLVAWLHISNMCNLRCCYCYIHKTNETMDLRTGQAAIDTTIRSALAHRYRAIKLKYAGGEPLIGFPLIVELHRYARSLADRHCLAVDGVVLSNGTLLTPEMVEVMLSLDLRLMISLDGLGDSHNCHRSYANGYSSVVDVTRAVDLALTCGLVPDISITISGRNITGLPKLTEWVLERNLPFSLNFYRENDFSAPETDLRLEEEHIIAGMIATYKVIEAHLPRRSLLASLLDRANLAVPHSRSCSAGHSYLVFDCNGYIAQCQMDIRNTVTDINDPDPLARVRNSIDGFRNLTVDEKVECNSCSYRYWCAGGCPLETYRATRRYDLRSPNCNIYRTLCPEVIRLEGLRLLRYAGQIE